MAHSGKAPSRHRGHHNLRLTRHYRPPPTPRIKHKTGPAKCDPPITSPHHLDKALERENDTSDEEWSWFLTPLEIDGVEAGCAIRLRRPARAASRLEHAIAGYAGRCARNLTIHRVRLARARLDMGAADGAAETLHQALDDLSTQVFSWRVTNLLDTVAERLAAYPTAAGVAGFLDRYEAINQ